MPGTIRDELGRRIFLVQAEKAVWDAVEKIRRTPGGNWEKFSREDHEMFIKLLGQVWASVSREDWEGIAFSRVGAGDIMDILDIGKALEEKEIGERKAVSEIYRILTHSR